MAKMSARCRATLFGPFFGAGPVGSARDRAAPTTRPRPGAATNKAPESMPGRLFFRDRRATPPSNVAISPAEMRNTFSHGIGWDPPV